MPALSTAQIALLRSGAPTVDYFLAIAPRAIVLQCSLDNANATWGLHELTYDGVTEGAWYDVEAGQTLEVYTSAGVEKGKVRVRSITAAQITVAYNDDIEWADDDILRVVDVFEPWSRPTRIEDTASGLVFYKDGDVEWSSNADAFRPKANDLGSFVGWINESGYCDVPFDASDSFATADGAAISSYSLSVTGGAFVAGGPTTAESTVRFSHAGFYWAVRTVTDSNGETGSVRMPIWIFGGDYQPFTDFEITRRSYGERSGEAQIRAAGDEITPDDIPENGRVVLFARTYIEGVEIADDFNCPFEGRGNIKLDGWVVGDDTNWDPETGTVTFALQTIDRVADDMPGYATFIEDVASGSEDGWHTGSGLTICNTTCWLLQWHTNLLELAYLECEPTNLIAGRKFEKAPPLKQIEKAFLMQRGVFARLGCTRWGSLHIRYDPQELSESDRGARATVMDITNVDWIGELTVEKAHRPQLSSILGGGIAYDGLDGEPYRARAPGDVGRESGRDLRIDNLIIQDQDDLNALLGRLLAAQSSQWRDLPVDVMYDVFEPALQEYVTLTVSSAENPRGYEFDTSDYWIVRRVEVEDAPGDAPAVRLTAERLAGELDGVTIPIPDPPDYPAPPAPPELPPPDEPLPDYATGEVVVMAVRAQSEITGDRPAVIYTLDALSGNPPTWYELNSGLAALERGFPRSMCMDPLNQSQNLALIAQPFGGSSHLYTNASWREGASWTEALSNADAQALVPTGGGVGLRQCYAFAYQGTTYLLVTARYDSPSPGQTRVLVSSDWGTTWDVYPAVYSYHSIWGSPSLCSYSSTLEWQANRYGTGAQGQLVQIGGSFLLGGRGAGSQGRSCVAMHSLEDIDAAWKTPCYVPSTADPSCTECPAASSLGNSIGGNRDVLTFSETGPGGMCPGPNYSYQANTYAYIASWVGNEDVYPTEPMQLVKCDNGGVSLLAGLADDIYGEKQGMLVAAPDGSSKHYILLEVRDDYPSPGDVSTFVYVGKDGDFDEVDVFEGIGIRTGRCFAQLLNGYAIAYLGRSFEMSEFAGAGDEEIFWASERLDSQIAAYWTDKTGNAYDLGARGVIAIEVDESSD